MFAGAVDYNGAYFERLVQMAEAVTASPESSHRAYYSGIELIEAEDSNRPLIVAALPECYRSLSMRWLREGEEASEIARWQVKNGAHIVDVCLQSSDREELKDIDPFYAKLMPKIKVPVMIDTT